MGKYPRLTARRNRILSEGNPEGVKGIVLTVPQVDIPCEFAEKITHLADMVLATLENTNQLVHVNRAKILITDQYFRVRRTLPIYHQDTTNYNNHPCIYQAFVAAYERLERKELEVAPPAFELKYPIRPRSRKKVVPPPDLLNPDTIRQLILDE